MVRADYAKRSDYSPRDRHSKVTFYVPLWKRKNISLEMFDDYWRNVHGPVCARLPGQHQYWQFHLSHNSGNIFPRIAGIEYNLKEEDQFDGIAELTFTSEAERETWFKASAILMDDEYNIFSKAIGYNTSLGNSQTYIDGISTSEPNGKLGVLKFHVMVKKSDAASVSDFRQYMTETFAPNIAKSDLVLKLRLHLFDEVDNSRPDAPGVVHIEPPEKQYQAAFEIAFSNHLDIKKFFASKEYAAAVKNQAKYVRQISTFPERTAYTFVYDGKMTLAGQRSSTVAELITNIKASNQLQDDITSLMLGQAQQTKTGLGHLLQGVQHIGVTVDDMAKSLEFYTQVLGGKYVVAEHNMIGDGMQNTLFQKEELDSIAQGIDMKTLGIPNLRDSKNALDVNFISFGNTCIELLQFKQGAAANGNTPVQSSIPSHVGNVNAMHLSFHVKDDVDLNVFAKMLEEECQKRGMNNVVCNRIIRVKSEAERKAVALKYNSTKFWEDPELLALGEAQADYGEFEGWSLFYCKGPSGEQLEFNQVTRKVKNQFSRAQEEYNLANNTSFAPNNGNATMANSTVSNGNGKATIATQKPASEKNIDLVKRLFSRGEAFDSAGFVTFFTDKPLYQFGNFEVCLDKATIKQSADNFFSQISAVYHDIKTMWEVGDVVFVEMDVTYWRKDNSVITLPCCDIFRVVGDKFSELRIFMDVNPVFNPSIQVPETSSVMTVSEGKRMMPPDTMKKHFAEHAEGKERVANGFAPKWSIDGPKWQINGNINQSTGNLIAKVEKMVEALTIEDWETFYPYFTYDLYYKVGGNEPVYGPHAAARYLAAFYQTVKPTHHKVRGAWEMGDTVIIEMDANYKRIRDGKEITVPCTDVYRFEGNLIKEWRVYPDTSRINE